jgi:phytoene dehydrogenase-like protein
MDAADVIVVGGGHNGLICAAYLARSGIDTLLVESRPAVGGCASTVSDLGARFNICNCDHTMIRAMPVIDELDLAARGLRYLEAEASFLHLFYDDAEPWSHFHDIDRMLDGLASTYPKQVEGYRRYLHDAMPVAELAIEMARTPPTIGRLLRRVAGRRARGAIRLLDWSRRSATSVLSEYFDDWHVTMPAVSAGPTVWGVHPDTPGTGLAAAAYATRHVVRTGRPAGGSGALTDAVRASLEAAGGTVRCDSRVRELIVDDGAVAGVRLLDGTTLRAPVVVAACDPDRVFVDWMDDVPAAARRLARRAQARSVQYGYESKIDAVLTELPRFRVADRIAEHQPDLDQLGPTMIVSPSPDQLTQAHERRESGRVGDHPTLLTNVPSVLDPSMKPAPDRHVLSLEVLFTPYDHPGGWSASAEPERWLELWARFVEPGALDSIENWRVMTPESYEAEFLMHRGHTPSYAATPLATLVGRDRAHTRYRTPIVGLYLSGAGTFPGAGIFGAAGRNTAAVVRRDLRGSLGPVLDRVRRGVAARRAR